MANAVTFDGAEGTGGGFEVLTVTVAVALAVPPVPVHVSVYEVVAVGLTICVPLVASEPFQPPEAVHAVAFVLDHVSVELLPAVMLAGLAASDTVGVALPPPPPTFTVTLAEPDPLVPVQVSVYAVVLVGETVAMPLVAFAPVQPPLAVQEVALVVDQVKFELLPDVIVVGLAVKVTVGVAEAAEPVNPRFEM